MPFFPFGETITIVSRGVTGQDGDGNDVYGTTETDVPGCAFAPAGSVERVQGQDLVITSDTVYLPDGASAPRATDQIRARGNLYDIDGDPQVFVNPFDGSMPGPVVKLKRAA